jgi:hypothetical protein
LQQHYNYLTMRVVVLFFLLISFSLTSQVNLINEDFENGGSIPTNWSEEFVSGFTSWEFDDGDYWGSISSSNSGSYNALLSSFSSGEQTKLVSPVIDFSSYPDNASLSFYLGMAEGLSGEQEQLNVYYKTSSGGAWVSLSSYTSEVANWTQYTVNLPSVNSTYYIGFEGLTDAGNGVIIDDVVVSAQNLSADPPSNFSITSGDSEGCQGNISITWNDPGDADSFDLYYCTGSACDPTTGTSITDVSSPYSFSASSADTEYVFQIKANNSGGSTYSSNTSSRTNWSGFTWSGATSTDFNSASNWCGASAPGDGDNVTIPDLSLTAFPPHMGEDLYFTNDLTILSGGYLFYTNDQDDTYYWDIEGDLINNGTLTQTGTAFIHVHNVGSEIGGSGTYNNVRIEISDRFSKGAELTLVDNVEIEYVRIINDGATLNLDSYTLKSYGFNLQASGGFLDGIVNLNTGILQLEGEDADINLDGEFNSNTGLTYYASGETWAEVDQVVESVIYYDLDIKTHASNTVSIGSASDIQVNHDFEILNGGNADLVKNITVYNDVNLTSGTVTLNNKSFILESSASIEDYSNIDYFITNGTGVLKQKNLGSTGRSSEVVYPVGYTATTYSPAFITNSGTADDYDIRVTNNVLLNGTSGAIISEYVVDHTWYIDESVIGGSSVDLKLNWHQGMEIGNFNRNSCYVSHYGSSWEQQSLGESATLELDGSYSALASNLTDFSPYAVASNNVLPVEVISLDIHCANQLSTIKLISGSMFDVERFQIEGSHDGSSWQLIESYYDFENSNYNQEILFPIHDPNYNYYQLVEVDYNGTKNPLKIFANPCEQSYIFEDDDRIYTSIENIKFTLYSSNGQLLSSNHQSLSRKELKPGVYFLTYYYRNQYYVKRLLIVPFLF